MIPLDTSFLETPVLPSALSAEERALVQANIAGQKAVLDHLAGLPTVNSVSDATEVLLGALVTVALTGDAGLLQFIANGCMRASMHMAGAANEKRQTQAAAASPQQAASVAPPSRYTH